MVVRDESYRMTIGEELYVFMDCSDLDLPPLVYYNHTREEALRTLLEARLDTPIKLMGNVTKTEEVVTVEDMRKRFGFQAVCPRPRGIVKEAVSGVNMFGMVARGNNRTTRGPSEIYFGEENRVDDLYWKEFRLA